jgi:hypothetical protein
MQQHNWLVEAMAQIRSRQSWNDRLTHWEKPASDSEEQIVQRAAITVRNALAKNDWLVREGVRIEPQGSYHNNTNVRQESDIDLRAVHPLFDIVYADNVNQDVATQALNYNQTGRTTSQIVADMRREMTGAFIDTFGALNVDTTGNKAIRVKSVPGSRAPVDVAPCLKLDYVEWIPAWRQYLTREGIAIFPSGGQPIFNFPEQHYRNAIDKRANTQHRFKRNVRMLKRLRDELVDIGTIAKGEVPSFLVESLVYGVEDGYFLVETDDRLDRLVRVVERISGQLDDQAWVGEATEINGIKFLFRPSQPWSRDAAKKFTLEAWRRLNGSS